MESRSTVILLIVLAGVFTVGSFGSPLGENPEQEPSLDPEALINESASALSSEPVQGVRVEAVRRGDEFERVTVAVAERPPNRSRREVLNVARSEDTEGGFGSNESESPTIVVRNGTESSRFYESDREVVRSSLSEGYFLSRAQTFGIFDRRDITRYNLTYVGTETVGDRQTHVVRITPSEELLAELSVEVGTGDDGYSRTIAAVGDEDWQAIEETWYIDTETDYPVKRRLEFLDENGSVVALRRHTYRELTVGETVPESRFTFDPPPDADVIETESWSHERLDDNVTNAEAFGLDRERIQIPDGWERTTLVGGQESETLSATYRRTDSNEFVTLTVTKDAPPGFGTAAAEQEIERRQVIERNVSSVNGTLSGWPGGLVLVWRCGDNAYQLAADTDASLLVEFADEIGCGS